jgi:hypothetical protein
MFAVRNTSKESHNADNYDIPHKKGRRRVASTPVHSKHCFGVFRSDLPPLSNPKSIQMRNTNGRCATGAAGQTNAHELLLDIYLADSTAAIKATLTDFFLEYMQNEVIDLADRQRAVFHYRTLTEALDGVQRLGEQHYQNQNVGRAAV